jgi:hypothetical protein
MKSMCPQEYQRPLADVPIHYEWDEWKIYSYLESNEDMFVKACESLEPEALIAFAIAQAEWIVARLCPYLDAKIPQQYLEAAWCALIDRHYASPVELDGVEWSGPVKGPIRVAVAIINDALYDSNGLNFTLPCATLMKSLAEHILVHSERFDRWQDSCMERLLRTFPIRKELRADVFSQEEPTLVPREIFDLEYPFTREMATPLLRSFLSSVDYTKNPFLSSPEVMVHEGFRGTPYTL